MNEATRVRSSAVTAGRSPLRDRVLIGLAVSTLFGTAWLLWGPAPVVVSWLIQVSLNGVLTWTAWRVAALAGNARPVRRFWRGVAAAGALFALGDGLQTFFVLADPGADPSSSTPQIILVGAGVACVIWVTLTHPLQTSDRERVRLWLDAATVMSAVAVFAWALTLPGGSLPDTADRVLAAAAACALMLVSAFGLVRLLLGGVAPFTVRAGIVGGLAAALSGLATSTNSLFTDAGNERVVMVLRLLPCILLAATPRVQELQMRTDPGVLTSRRRRPYSLLPYLAIGGTQILLLALMLGEHLSPRAWGAVVGVIVSTALVVLRQLVALGDNARLLARLDASMLELRRKEERFRSLVQHSSDITLVITPTGEITYGSPALDQVLGRPGPDHSTGSLLAMLHPDDRDTGQLLIRQLLEQPTKTVTMQLRARHADGGWRWLEVIGTNLLGQAAVAGLVLNARDVTDARQFQDRLHFQATHDNLTQLANRELFHERIRLASLTHGPSGVQASIIAIDLDDFKRINDTFGHHAGDAILVAVADRLNSCVRPTDTIARLGGDEFAIVLPEATRAGAFAVAERVMAAFAEPVLVEGRLLPIKASLGIAVGSTDDAEALLRAADAAMYAAKHSGKGGYVFADRKPVRR